MPIKCSGLSTKNDHHPNFICKHCSEHAKIDPHETSKQDPTPSIETSPEPCDFWKISQDEHIETLRKIYNEVVHQSSLPLAKKVGFKVADVINIIFTKTIEDRPQSECAMICTMIMPHSLLARSKKMILQ